MIGCGLSSLYANGGSASARFCPRARHHIHGSSFVGLSGVDLGVIAHVDGAAGSITIGSTVATTDAKPAAASSSRVAAYDAPRTTFVPHDSATDTITAYVASASSAPSAPSSSPPPPPPFAPSHKRWTTP
eukprot:31537-Pelagococcus_subviridis.AAC.7